MFIRQSIELPVDGLRGKTCFLVILFTSFSGSLVSGFPERFTHDGVKGANKHWRRAISEDELPQEQTYLDGLYHRGSEHAHYDYKDARNRFKALS